MNAGITQEELLVARTQRRCQEIRTRMFQVSTEQNPAPEEIGRITSIGNSTGTMVGNQHQHNWTFI